MKELKSADIVSIRSIKEDETSELKTDLKDKHISLMALAGIIGPGILIGASLALENGPAS